MEYLDCTPPFSICSQKLGLEQFEKDLDTYRQHGYIMYNGHKCPIPRYFREKFDIPVLINPLNSPYRQICIEKQYVSKDVLPELDKLCVRDRCDEYFNILKLRHPNGFEEIDKIIKHRNNMYKGTL